MNRRGFIGLSIGLTGLLNWIYSCTPDRKINGKIIGASSLIGHLLKEKKFPAPSANEQTKIIIIGAGISGLSSAWYLNQKGIKDFLLLDLEGHTGGNSSYGKNSISSYPWGAHYIPIPNNDLPEYINFLKNCNVITGEDANGLPIYNETHLCFDPQERLYINGRWQDGLIPQFGVPDDDKKQIASFLNAMDEFRYMRGSDGKDAFAIPVDNSSKDTSLIELDKLTMKKWMTNKGFTSEYLHWYVNYCCRDDFGTPHHLISAWAGIHYYASRKGKGNNAEHADVLTWPEGNGFFVEQLQKDLIAQIKTNSLATKVLLKQDTAIVEYFDTKEDRLKAIKAEQCIIAVPQFVACRLLNDGERRTIVNDNLRYVPWMVANILANKLDERSGAPLSWDNVIHESDSLGYVNATHELLQQDSPKKNLTYYLPLTNLTPAEERKLAQAKDHSFWTEHIINDLKKIHPNIREAIEEVNVMVWGHAMAQPLPGVVHGDIRNKLSASINNKIHFAHTDLAGVSIFEEAFYQGITAAKKAIDSIKQ
jgi:protoporphyrinogen oxidase